MVLKNWLSSDFLVLKKGETSATISSAGDGKATMREKAKRAFYRTRFRMDFDPKTSKLCDQEAVDKYLANYGFQFEFGD